MTWVGAPWTKDERDQVRVVLFGWPSWTADRARAQEAFNTMPSLHPDDVRAAQRLLTEWEAAGIPASRVLTYIPAGVTSGEARRFETDPETDVTSEVFQEQIALLAALRK